MDRVSQLKKIQDECRELFEKKNKDYGDSFSTYGTVGVLVRISDKLRRFTNISSKSVEIQVSDETLRDTLMDLHNYSAMAIMLLNDKKPNLSPVRHGFEKIELEQDININEIGMPPPPPPSKNPSKRWADEV
tara:strand:+ start:3923 stop:4318 length:396 start_codon:yes stop_codon:yes gene_type:complete